MTFAEWLGRFDEVWITLKIYDPIFSLMLDVIVRVGDCRYAWSAAWESEEDMPLQLRWLVQRLNQVTVEQP